jgi:hypothetical protein
MLTAIMKRVAPKATDPKARRVRAFQRAWDKERSRAISPSDMAEIDAIFQRHAGENGL